MRKLIEVYNNNRESVKDSVTIAKEGFITVREMTILLVLTLFLTSVDFESFLMRKLNHAGITEVMGVKLQTQQQQAVETAKESSQRVSELENQVNELAAIINKTKTKIKTENKQPVVSAIVAPDTTFNSFVESKPITSPAVKQSTAHIDKITKQVEKIQQTISVAKEATSTNLATQQTNLSVIDPHATIPMDGWVYLGKLNNEKTDWDDGKPNPIDLISYKDLKVGITVKTFRNANLRSNPSPLANSTILAALLPGEELSVQEIFIGKSIDNQSPTCWVRIKRHNINQLIEAKKK